MLKYSSVNFVEKQYLHFLSTQEIRGKPFHDKIGQLNNFYLPVCEKIYHAYKKNKKIQIIGLAGGQGAGKSTITQILKLILEIKYNLSVASFSIDDFYKTLNERTSLAKNVHKLFKIRGVPGTHDTNLIQMPYINFTIALKSMPPHNSRNHWTAVAMHGIEYVCFCTKCSSSRIKFTFRLVGFAPPPKIKRK